MGFGKLLHMKMTEIPGQLCKYVLENFSAVDMRIKLEKGYIDVTRESVNEILGLPMGKQNFTKLDYRKPEDTSYDDWASQFPNRRMIRLNEVRTQIGLSNEADMNFKMNFICVMINSLLESSSSGKCNFHPLNYIMRDTDIINIDWCQYMIDCLVKEKGNYKPESTTMFFHGPTAYLALIYVDRVKCDYVNVSRARPAICHWTSDKLCMRETYEQDIIGGFGKSDLNEPFVGGVHSEEDDDYLSKEDYESKIASLIDEGFKKFPESIRIKSLKIRLEEIDDEQRLNKREQENKNNDDDGGHRENVGDGGNGGNGDDGGNGDNGDGGNEKDGKKDGGNGGNGDGGTGEEEAVKEAIDGGKESGEILTEDNVICTQTQPQPTLQD